MLLTGTSPELSCDIDTLTDAETESFSLLSPHTRSPRPFADGDFEDESQWAFKSLHSLESTYTSSPTFATESPVLARSPVTNSSQLQPDRSAPHPQPTPPQTAQKLATQTNSDAMISPGVYKIVNYKSGTVLGMVLGELTKVTCSPENDAVGVNKWLVTPLGSGAIGMIIRPFHDHQAQSPSGYLGPGTAGGGIGEHTPLGVTAYPTLVWNITQALFIPSGQTEGKLPDEGVIAVIGWPHGNLVLDLHEGKAERGNGVNFQPLRSHFEPWQYWRFIRCDEGTGTGAPQQPAQIGWSLPATPVQARDVGSWANDIPPQAAGEPPRTIRRKVVEEETTEDSGEEGTGVVRKIVKTTTTTLTEISMVTL